MNLKASLLKDKKITTEKLRQENKKMELRLQQLKLAMDKEKEERLSNGTQSNWSTGSPGALLNYKPNISGIDSGKKIRLKMLKEETLPSVRSANLKSNILKDIAGGDSLLPKSDINIELNGFGRNIVHRSCGQCEENQAAVNCKECAEDYCPKCFAAFHLKGALRKHRSTPISTLNNRVSIPSPLFKPPDFKNLSNNSSQSKISSNREVIKKTKFSDLSSTENKEDLSDNSKENLLPKYSNSSLADGEYNEESSNQYFQEAMHAWRHGIDLSEQAKFQQKLPTIEHSTETNSTDNNPKSLTDLIQFTPSLTYAEQLLLRKHRSNQLAPVDMKYILARLTKTNEKELLENQKLLQSNLVLETSLINSTTENALKNNEYHIDFESVNQLLNEAELISGRLTSMSTREILKSTFKIEEVPSPCDEQKIDKISEQIESVTIIENQKNEFEKNIEFNNLQTNNDNCEPLHIKLEPERPKSVINRNNFYDKPLSSRKLSARIHNGGNITSKPSVLLNILANLNSFLPMETDKISSSIIANEANEKRPSSANVSTSTNKISYNFYKLTPNSWKPSQAWSDGITNEKSNETDKYMTNTSSTIEDQIDEEIKIEITKLNLLTNFRNNKDEDCPVSDRISSSETSDIGENNYDMLRNVDAIYYDEDSEKHEILDQLNTLERELTVLSKQEHDLSQNNYDEIIADSLDIANDNEFINSMDSDKFCFEDSLDFQQRHSNNSNTINIDYDVNDDEEMLVACSSRFDDYEDVYQLN